jgi:thiopeptide-type bacteriocin biosynthesis protein
MNKYLESRTIWNITINTYNRELERYFGISTNVAEQFFDTNSKLILDVLRDFHPNQHYFFGFLYVDYFLDLFKFTLVQKLNFIRAVCQSFFSEFRFNKELGIQMDLKARVFSKSYADFIINGNDEQLNSLSKSIKLAHENLISQAQLVQISLNPRQLDDFIQSVLHMHFNRLYRTSQRESEFLSYYILEKSFVSIQKRKKLVNFI